MHKNNFGSWLAKSANSNLTILLQVIAKACAQISSELKYLHLSKLNGVTNDKNVHGEIVTQADILANTIFISALKSSGLVSLYCSEEESEPHIINTASPYIVVFDPLDGSSNVDANIAVGTIFAIYAREDIARPIDKSECLQPGQNIISAGYCLYSNVTELVVSVGNGVSSFSLNDRDTFICTRENIRIGTQKIISVNTARQQHWSPPVKSLFETYRHYSYRYVGSMVADIHRTLIYGGIFLYPGFTSINASSENKNYNNGKLRLLYEANPMAFLLAEAGAESFADVKWIHEVDIYTAKRKLYTLTTPILSIVPQNYHQRVPVFMGSF